MFASQPSDIFFEQRCAEVFTVVLENVLIMISRFVSAVRRLFMRSSFYYNGIYFMIEIAKYTRSFP